MIDLLMGRADEDFSNSFILVKNSKKGDMPKAMYTSGYYAGIGGVAGLPDGTIRIANVPVVGVSCAAANSYMVIDADYLERVVTKDLRVEFAYEDMTTFAITWML